MGGQKLSGAVNRTGYKRCSKCQKKKRRTAFNRHRRQKDGLQPQCRFCSNGPDGKKGWRVDNPKRQRFYETKLRDPKKKVCYRVYRQALSNGTLVRPGTCEHCQQPKRVEGHHPNYDRPLDVWWLCRSCHENVHRGLRVGPRRVTPSVGEEVAQFKTQAVVESDDELP